MIPSPDGEPGPASPPHATSAPRTVGPWLVLGEIGRGRIWTVLRVRRADGAHEREAALKLIGAGASLPDLLQRVPRERRILSTLTHPNIATLLDAGAADDGRPYLVMELVEGEPIAAWADARRLSIRARLELFLPVCAAVQFAHERLVVHRRIQPSSIRVTSGGVPKLLDFGLARLLGDEPDHGPPISPSEAGDAPRDDPDDASTVADVRALGGVLHVLLTGREVSPSTRPSETFRSTVRGDDGHGDSTAASRAAARSGTPDRLRRRLLGDLDAIVARARSRVDGERYSSVADLAADLRNHVAHRPVSARPDTALYRAGAFARRHRAGLFGIGVVAGTLCAGIVSTTLERLRAERRFEYVRRLANSLLFEIHESIRDLPGSTRARGLVVRRALEYLDRLAADAGRDEVLRRELAEAYVKVGDVQGNPFQANLGDTPGARTSYSRAASLLEPLLASGRAPENVKEAMAEALLRTSNLLGYLGDGGAVAPGRRAVALLEEVRGSAPTEESARALVQGYSSLAYVYASLERQEEALAAADASDRALRPLLLARPDDASLRRSRGLSAYRRGGILERLQRFDEAIAAFEQSRDSLSPATPEEAASVKSIRSMAFAWDGSGSSLSRVGRLEEAEAAHRKALELRERLAAGDPQDVEGRINLAFTHFNLGSLLRRSGRGGPARSELEASLAILDPIVAADPGNRWAVNVLARLCVALGDAHRGRASRPSRAACSWYRRGRDAFDGLEKAGYVFTPMDDDPSRAAAARALDQCASGASAGTL